ncbi:alpha-glucosidase, partial [Tremellales sp. Uapishka_1]
MLQSDPAANWWRQAVIYQIYPRSFADDNGDGIGDLKGITARIPYLKALGIDAVWLSPFYPSALKDGGYDVADYRDVDPKIGTLEQFDEMMLSLKSAGIRVMVDIVPNHTSDDHEWFQAAVKAGKGSAERERYIFRDGLGAAKDIPPTDWQAQFGGAAWSPSGADDGQFYFHMFDPAQPDLNWDHPDVRDDFIKTLRFWGDRGVSGFRIDVAHALMKDMREPLPSWKELVRMTTQKLRNGNAEMLHPILDRDEVQDIYRSWRKVFNEYNPPLIAVAECWVAPDRKHLYAAADGLGQAFSFDILLCNFNAEEYRHCIKHSLAGSKSAASSTTWVLSNHDMPRHATRFGMPDIATNENHPEFMAAVNEWLVNKGQNPKPDLTVGVRRARAATLMLLGLPGSTYIYQGEELGLPEVFDIPAAHRQDPTFHRTQGAEIGRDGCRVPLPWVAGKKNFGFGNDRPPHLPQPDWMKSYSVDVQEKDAESTLQLYRDAINLRKDLQTLEQLEWVENEPGVLHYERPNGWTVVMNTTKEAVALPVGRVLLASISGGADGGKLAAETTVWLKA